MEDVNISKFRAQVVRAGSTPASPGFVVSEGQNPVDPSGSGQNHLPVTIGSPANGLAVTDAQILTIDKAQIFAGTSSQFVKGDGTLDSTAYGTGSVTSVALTMPAAFSVAGSPITTAGTLAVTATGTTAQYIRGDGSLATFPGLTGFVPYTGATADVNLGTHDLLAERGTFANNGSSDTLTVNHTSGSGYGIIVTKGGNNEALYVSKTSGSGNAMTVIGGRTSLVDLALSSVTNTAGDFLTLSGGVVHKRTAAQTLTDIGGQAALTNPVTGTGTSGQVAYFTGTTTISSESTLFWNSTNDRLGIGLNNPDSILHIFGSGSGNSLTFTKYTCGDGGDIRVGKESGVNNDAIFGTWSNNAVIFYANSGEAIRITNQKNIEIGTYSFTSPSGADRFVGVYGAQDCSLILQDNVQLWELYVNDDFFINRGSTSSAVFKTNGNVLIGTTTDAGYKLDVNGTGRFNGTLRSTTGDIRSINTGSDTPVSGPFYLLGDTTGTNFFLNQLNASNGLDWFYYNGTFSSSLFRLASTGAATFSNSVSVKSPSTSAESFIARYSSNNVMLQLFESSSGTDLEFNLRNGAGTAVNRLSTNGNSFFNGGNVLIGTTTDNSHKLRVNGDLWVDGVYKVPVSSYFICGSAGYRFNNTTDAFNNFVALDNGNATLRGTLTQNASDERLKNNIEIIPNAIDKIKQLRGVTFKWNQELYETSRTFDIGVIAQEVEKVLPNAVCLAPFDTNFDDNTSKSGQNYLTVYYEKLIPLLIEGIKELKQEIDTLKN
jgi:hypothetical protein